MVRVSSVQHAQLELGWVLHPDFQGRGYAREAAGAVLDFVFETLHPHRVQAFLDARNAASAALCERLGMRREATHPRRGVQRRRVAGHRDLRHAAPRVGGAARLRATPSRGIQASAAFRRESAIPS